MKRAKPPSPRDAHDEISALIETLHLTGQRLEELTAGEVDAVADRDGRTFLLRHAQEQLRESEAAKQAAILNALPAHIAVLDTQGIIISVNEAWRKFAGANALRPGYGIGLDYLAVCDCASGDGASEAQQAARGIRSVLAGAVRSFSLEYSCHSPTEKRWFLMTVTPLAGDHPNGVVVMHLDITERKRSEEVLRRFVAAMDAIADGIYLTDRSTMRYVHVNDAACRQRNLTREELLALGPMKLLSKSRAEVERDYDAVIDAGGAAEPFELLWSRADGSPLWVELRRHAQWSGDRWTIVTLVRDITERKKADARIAYLNRVYAVLSGINTLIVRARDREELFREACRIAVEAGGFRMAWLGVLDQRVKKIVLVASAGVNDELLAELAERYSMNELGSSRIPMITRAIAEKTVVVANDLGSNPTVVSRESLVEAGIGSLAILPLVVSDEAVGVLTLYAGESEFFREEELKLLTELAGDIAFAIDHIGRQERLDFMAYYDELTGLANRKLFLDRVTQYMRSAVSDGHKLAVFLIDLERFKNINDSLGRAAGDALLRQVAEWLTRNAAGDANLVARVGADQFAAVLPHVRAEGNMARLVEGFNEAFLNHPFRLNDAVFRIAFKVGVALFPDDGTDADTLFKNAEAALKKAKASGERYLFYTQTMTAAVAGKLTLENQLRQALDNGEFVLHYQPKVNLASGKIAGAEALIRWNDPRTGLVPPGRFIPILEEIGLIYDVGRWALRQTIADYLRWRDAGLAAVRIAVNVSPLQLRNRGFVDEVRQVIGIDARASDGLELEITESLIMEDVKHNIASLQAIRAMGICIAIDDFGTGFSSLNYLAKLPVHTLKIDRSFVIDMAVGQQGLALVSTIINMAHALKLKVVAEGVETEEQKRLLRLLDCDEMQGFLFSKPVPAEVFETRFLIPTHVG
ncbi:MAG: EAL domain-containing protein [Sulfuritalea sp.]|jgi:diguanylate cyclase (GGDEF)-like protein/PAS domain S-box-containing protein|nr:EAL domain-containing protein [Sulfuritalea sp.]